uniref:Fibrinogen C-terminal domain-containing protein n=1 Tax=Oreochromis aureus TaxID=47969 RepID=A0AAZ1XK56_OREAU
MCVCVCVQVYCDMDSLNGRWTRGAAVWGKPANRSLAALLQASRYSLLEASRNQPSCLHDVQTKVAGRWWYLSVVLTSLECRVCPAGYPPSRPQVFQRRTDGSVNFYRPWSQYKMGFGNPAREYWLGLERLFHLTLRKRYELLVDMEDFSGNKAFARYSSFSIDPESYGYRLHVSGFINGGAGDSLSAHNGQKFSTFDKDQDSSDANCAKSFQGAFWYNNCHEANPNGVYRWGADGTIFAVGVEWYHWKGHDYSLKTISMKIRPVQ